MGFVKKSIDGMIASYSQASINLAEEVIKGKWGNGPERIQRLIDAGYDPNEVQAIVNKMLKGEKIEVETIDVTHGVQKETPESANKPIVPGEEVPKATKEVETMDMTNSTQKEDTNNPIASKEETVSVTETMSNEKTQVEDLQEEKKDTKTEEKKEESKEAKVETLDLTLDPEVTNKPVVPGEEISSEQALDNLYSKVGEEKERMQCVDLVKRQLREKGLIEGEVSLGDGKDVAKRIANSQGLLKEGHTAEAIDPSAFKTALNEGTLFKDVVISFDGGNGHYKSKYGHTLMVSEVKNGTVYFIDNYDTKNTNGGTWGAGMTQYVMPVDEFIDFCYGDGNLISGVTKIC